MIKAMKGIFLNIFVCFFIVNSVNSQEILIEGNYWNKNLYLYNPMPSNNSCVKYIIVNNKVVDSLFTSNSIIIDLKNLGLQYGDNLVLLIQHDENCEPIISNPDAVKPTSELIVESFKYTRRSGLLQWDIADFDKGKTLELEQYLWGKWIKALDLGLTDTMGVSTFSPMLISKLNLFRIKQYDPNNKTYTYTKSIKVRTGNKNVLLEKIKVSDKLVFSEMTHYEIYTADGTLLMSGIAKDVDVSKLTKGDYWINFDINTAVFKKK